MSPFWWKSGKGFLAYSRKRLLLLSGDMAMGIWARKYRYCSTGLCKDEQRYHIRDKVAAPSTSPGSLLRSGQAPARELCARKEMGKPAINPSGQGTQEAKELSDIRTQLAPVITKIFYDGSVRLNPPKI